MTLGDWGGPSTSSRGPGERLSLVREQDPPSRAITVAGTLAVGQAGVAGFTEEVGRAVEPQLCMMLGPDLTHAAHMNGGHCETGGGSEDGVLSAIQGTLC